MSPLRGSLTGGSTAVPKADAVGLQRYRRSAAETLNTVASDQQADVWKRGALGITAKPDELLLLVLESVASCTKAA